METREVRVGRAELRAERTEQGIRLSGHPIVYGVRSVDLGGFTEDIGVSAATEALRTSDIRLKINHVDLPLARFRNGPQDTMEVEERADGVHFRTLLDGNDPDVQRIVGKIERGDVDGMSFAFFAAQDRWEGTHRTVTQISEITDFSIVTEPAYPDTSVALRSLEDAQPKEQLYPIEDARRALAIRSVVL